MTLNECILLAAVLDNAYRWAPEEKWPVFDEFLVVAPDDIMKLPDSLFDFILTIRHTSPLRKLVEAVL